MALLAVERQGEKPGELGKRTNPAGPHTAL